MVSVLGVTGGQNVTILGVVEDVGDGHVRDEEAAEDLRLEPQAVQARRQEAEEVLDGVLPLASLHEAPQVRDGEACVRVGGHPARPSTTRTISQES
jgi:hypothetical protein